MYKNYFVQDSFQILDRMEHTEVFPLDQVCYRILIELCGECGEPSLAVKVLQVRVIQHFCLALMQNLNF